jgi:hypothetical protein
VAHTYWAARGKCIGDHGYGLLTFGCARSPLIVRPLAGLGLLTSPIIAAGRAAMSHRLCAEPRAPVRLDAAGAAQGARGLKRHGRSRAAKAATRTRLSYRPSARVCRSTWALRRNRFIVPIRAGRIH